MSATCKMALRNLVKAAVLQAAENAEPFATLRGVALHDSARDTTISSLASFNGAASALVDDPLVQERYGSDQAKRLALQFVYETGEALDVPIFDRDVFERVWTDFKDELNTAEWIYRGIANIRNFESDETLLTFPDGVTIRSRSAEDLTQLGFDDDILSHLTDDFLFGGGGSSHVLVVEHRATKRPDNFINPSDAAQWTNAWRVIGALRLLQSGDIGIGRMLHARPSRFNVGLGGVMSTGVSLRTFGDPYRYSEAMAEAVTWLYAGLNELETKGYGAAPGNLDLALRAFMATYDRWPPGQDTKLIDSVTALEAVLGTDSEIAFKLAFRVAGLLATNDTERVTTFEQMKAFYGTRSTLVHGGQLKAKQQQLLTDVDDLREIVRRLLRGLVHLAVSGNNSFGPKFFQDSLDASLQHNVQREELRIAMGLAAL